MTVGFLETTSLAPLPAMLAAAAGASLVLVFLPA
jgi:hypothetical protein